MPGLQFNHYTKVAFEQSELFLLTSGYVKGRSTLTYCCPTWPMQIFLLNIMRMVYNPYLRASSAGQGTRRPEF